MTVLARVIGSIEELRGRARLKASVSVQNVGAGTKLALAVGRTRASGTKAETV